MDNETDLCGNQTKFFVLIFEHNKYESHRSIYSLLLLPPLSTTWSVKEYKCIWPSIEHAFLFSILRNVGRIFVN